MPNQRSRSNASTSENQERVANLLSLEESIRSNMNRDLKELRDAVTKQMARARLLMLVTALLAGGLLLSTFLANRRAARLNSEAERRSNTALANADELNKRIDEQRANLQSGVDAAKEAKGTIDTALAGAQDQIKKITEEAQGKLSAIQADAATATAALATIQNLEIEQKERNDWIQRYKDELDAELNRIRAIKVPPK